MNYSRELEIKSTYIDKNKFFELLNKLNNFAEQDSSSNKLDLKFKNFSGEGFSCSGVKEFADHFSDSLKNLESLYVYYYGVKINFSIRFYNYKIGSNLNINISANKKEEMLLIQDEIEKYFVNKSWNFLSSIILTPLVVMAFTVALIKIFPQISLLLFFVLLMPTFFVFSFWMPKYYPALVIEGDKEKSARILKRDVWMAMVLVVLPFIIDWIK